jgi:ABC-2 type transport system ATP-binding protein
MSPLCADGLSKRYGNLLALDGLTLELQAGEVFGYLGPNGAGKTTTLRLLMGFLRPSAGSARILGLDCWRQSVEVHARVGHLPGEPALYDRMTGRDHVAYLRHLRGDRDDAHARRLADRLDLDLDRPARALSRGNRQKLAIVLAMMARPPLLLLDEPTSGLDPLIQQEFLGIVEEHVADGGTVLLSSHVLAEVQRVADRIGVLRAGRLIAVERLDQLRAKALHHVRAHFADEPPTDRLAGVPGVRDITISDHTLSCSAPQSSLDHLLKRISAFPVVDFECVEADLEETFLTYYGSSASVAAPVPPERSARHGT